MSIGTLGDRLAWAMAERQLTPSELARRLGTKPQVVSPWMTGTPPGGRYLVQLPGVLSVNGHWLLTGEGPWEAPGDQPLLEAARREGQARAVEMVMRAIREVAAREGLIPAGPGQGGPGVGAFAEGDHLRRAAEGTPPPDQATPSPPIPPRRRRAQGGK